MDLQFKLHGVSEDYSGKQVALVLVAEHDGLVRCVGSAFSVAPGLAITASHVIDDCVTYQYKRDGYKKAERVISFTAVQSYEGKALVWAVDAIYGSTSSDIAFIRFVRPSWWGDGPGQVKPRSARLNLNPPAVGDNVRVFGFPKSELREGILNIFPAECECRVLSVDVRTKEPTWRKPLAHIELEGEIEHGMSGGPCFDSDWNVIGVNSSGWTGLQLAKVALLWPAMKIEVDLFKTGAFPAIDLFKSGSSTALGYRRVYVTSKGETRFSHTDPDSLKPAGFLGATEALSGAIDFSGAGAEKALAELRLTLAEAQNGPESLDSNRIIRLARYCFWDLEAALRTAILLAARQMKLSVPEPPVWDQLLQALKEQAPKGEVLDEIATLEFHWNGVDLFDLRRYAELSRSGVVSVQCLFSVREGKNVGPITAASLEPAPRKGGPQLFLPDGLDRFVDGVRRFVQKLLRLSASLNHAVGENPASSREHEASGE